jgi:hypothetical protein
VSHIGAFGGVRISGPKSKRTLFGIRMSGPKPKYSERVFVYNHDDGVPMNPHRRPIPIDPLPVDPGVAPLPHPVTPNVPPKSSVNPNHDWTWYLNPINTISEAIDKNDFWEGLGGGLEAAGELGLAAFGGEALIPYLFGAEAAAAAEAVAAAEEEVPLIFDEMIGQTQGGATGSQFGTSAGGLFKRF